MKKITIILVLFIGGFVQAQEKGIVEGIVLDKQQANAPMAFVQVSLKNIKSKTSTNIDGAFVLELDPGIYTLVFNFPGYKKIEASHIIVKADKITSIQSISLAVRELSFSQVEPAPKKEK